MRRAYIAVLLVLFTASCGREQAGTPASEPSRVATMPGTAQPAAAPAAPAKPQSEPAAAPVPRATTPAPRETPASEPPGVATQSATAEPAAEPVALAAPQPVAAAAPAPSAEIPAPTAASPLAPIAPVAPVAPKIAEPPAAVPELDLKALEDQLRQTKAIGFMTKITLKNQVDDLLDRFREHYRGKAIPTMKDLRRSYDLLMMKVLSLLQDEDQQLASAIVASREAIWGLLADPVKFETLQG